VDFRWSAEDEAFREEVRSWLKEHLVGEYAALGSGGGPADETGWDVRLEWEKQLGEAGWIGLGWPKAYGGRQASITQQLIFNEEYAKANAPARVSFFGEGLLGPTLIAFGTEEQKQRFLPGILRCTELWCQGFSEPDAGSDLANVKTRAILDGDEWVVNGQKVWTTLAHHSDWIFAVCRTDPDAPKHKGLSFILLPMDQPGIEVKPLKQLTGSAEFNEVFFTNVRAPKENVVGGLNNGWKVAMTTLGFERGSSATTSHRRFEKELDAIIDNARDNGKIDDPTIRQSLAKQWSKIQIMRINGYRTLSAAVQSKKDLGVAALGATNKMFWSETHRDTMNLAMDILGPHAQILTANVTDEDEFVPGYGRRRGRADYPVSILQASFFFSRSETIWGGTAEIQRNIVGERVLGLPKEPKPA
jgi:alkylation response protein AidB-like acyl-CoA dehydrogenase